MNCGECNCLLDIDKEQDGGYCFVTGNFRKFHNECDCPGLPIVESHLDVPAKELAEEAPKYCEFCFNSRIYKATEDDWFSAPLTDENDSSSISVGCWVKNRRMMISSGYGKPMRIECDEWLDNRQEWVTTSRYYPKYCPECGRQINEYERRDER